MTVKSKKKYPTVKLVRGRDFDGWCWYDDGKDEDYPAGLDVDTFGKNRFAWVDAYRRSGRLVRVKLIIARSDAAKISKWAKGGK